MSRALYQKMGIQEESKLCVLNPPKDFDKLFNDVPFELKWNEEDVLLDIILFFPKNIADLEDRLPVLQERICQNGMIWVSWFKKASKIPTDINENVIRDTALNLKLVDVKVCSINELYSGLKLVIRKALRKA